MATNNTSNPNLNNNNNTSNYMDKFALFLVRGFPEACKEIHQPENYSQLLEPFLNFLFDLFESNEGSKRGKNAFQTTNQSTSPNNNATISPSTSPTPGIFSSILPVMDVRMVLTWCTWLLCGGEQPDSYLQELKGRSRARVCNKVWNDGYYFYRCRECEQSPSR